MRRLVQALKSDDLYELLIVCWIAGSPFAIARWVSEFPDPVPWAAFIAGVLGVLVGWLVIAPYHFAKARDERPVDPLEL
jgi:hypothetical protein